MNARFLKQAEIFVMLAMILFISVLFAVKDLDLAKIKLDQAQEILAQANKDKATAQKEAEEMLKKAKQAQEDAEKTRKQTDAAKAEMIKAQQEKETAKREQDQANLERDTAKREAEQARQQTDTAKQQANQAQEEANIAKQEAITAQQEVEKAKQERDQAKIELKNAQQDEEKAKREQEQANVEMEMAKREAEQAKQQANQSQGEANVAKKEAAKAQQELDQTKIALNNAQQEIELTRTAAAQAQKERDTARKELYEIGQPIIILSEQNPLYRFETGSSTVPSAFENALRGKITKWLEENNQHGTFNAIEIIGHTDDQPIRGLSSNLDTQLIEAIQPDENVSLLRPGSNIDLGMMRAIAVLTILQEIQDEGRLQSIEYFFPSSSGQMILEDHSIATMSSNEDNPNRRRVEIRMLRYKPENIQ